MAKIIVTWSIAYDYIMKVNDEFKNIILPDQIDTLNVGFLVSDMQKSLWWTATNIAYNLWLLGMRDQTLMLGVVWHDFVPDERINQYVDFSHVVKIENDFTACAYVITDRKEHQMIPFYPGAMNQAERLSLLDFNDMQYCIVSPNGKDAMINLLEEAKGQESKTFFDPGQQLHAFSKDELLDCCAVADYLICNDHEFKILMSKLDLDEQAVLWYFEKVIVTLGKDGVKLFDGEHELTIPGIVVSDAVDPTWCGDALRAGLLYGLASGKTWEESLKIGNVVGSLAVRSQGTMNHFFTLDEVLEIFKNNESA